MRRHIGKVERGIQSGRPHHITATLNAAIREVHRPFRHNTRTTRGIIAYVRLDVVRPNVGIRVQHGDDAGDEHPRVLLHRDVEVEVGRERHPTGMGNAHRFDQERFDRASITVGALRQVLHLHLTIIHRVRIV